MTKAFAFAPGRVNLIGEHTDYNGGFVLPFVVPLGTTAFVTLRGDNVVRAHSSSVPTDASAEFVRGTEAHTGRWVDYVQGVASALDERGFRVPGFDLRVESTLPLGSGLGSSAALAVSILRALRKACQLPLSDFDIAMAAHRAETGIVGTPAGVMDQMASSLANDQEALFINTRTLETESVPMPPGVSFAVIDSQIRHQHLTGDYRLRRSECERAAGMLGVPLLSDLSVSDAPRINALPEPFNRRARHVVTENARVLAAVQAMRDNDVKTLGKLWTESHDSMRDDYDVSLPEIDTIVELALADDSVYGARLTGGGFGGSVIVLAPTDVVADVARRLRTRYETKTGQQVRVLLPATGRT